MILDISDLRFREIFDDPSFYLPIRWDGRDFSKTLGELYDSYISKIQAMYPKEDVKDIRRDCELIIRAVNHYLNGYPDKAYKSMEILMPRMMSESVRFYFQTEIDELQYGEENRHHPLYLFRATAVPDNQPYQRQRIFHTPYSMRSRVSTNRYSIAGFPSLYLGTSLELCCEEIHLNPHKGFSIASRFEPNVNYKFADKPISFIDLAIKPQDFMDYVTDNQGRAGRSVNRNILDSREARGAYLSWYPLIAACSYIRVNKEDPFAAEYIIPQLLMQWARSGMQTTKNHQNQLIGIRYFSCSSVRASDMGFNYVFPTSGEQRKDMPYCPVLSSAFRLTKPHYIHEYSDIYQCERVLIRDHDMGHV